MPRSLPMLLLSASLSLATAGRRGGTQPPVVATPHCPSTPGEGEGHQGDGEGPPRPRPRASPAGGDTATRTEPRAGAPRPHIVLAVFDDLGYNDLGSFSGGAFTPRTPFMDELMVGGIKLKEHYVTPICSPTRSALLTGRYPIRTGGHGAACRGAGERRPGQGRRVGQGRQNPAAQAR